MPPILTAALPARFKFSLKRNPTWAADVRLETEISDAFESLTTDATILQDFRFCFFIDGLDEFEQNTQLQRDTYATLATKLRNWTLGGHVKICVSSRHLLEFIHEFPATQRLTLQKVTESDIRTLVENRLEGNTQFAKLRTQSEDNDQRCDRLKHEILQEAEGVFLWVVLVLNEMEQALANSDSIQVLERIMATAYKDIIDFVHSILSSIPRVHQQGSYHLLAAAMQFLGFWTSEAKATAAAKATLELSWRQALYINLEECAMLFDAADRGILIECNESSAAITLDLEDKEAVTREKERLLVRCRGLVEVDPKLKLRFTHRAIPEALQALFFSRNLKLEDPVDDESIVEILTWIILAGCRLPGEDPDQRIRFLVMELRTYTFSPEKSERMLELLFEIQKASNLVFHGTVKPDDEKWGQWSWRKMSLDIIRQGAYDAFQIPELHSWVIQEKLSLEEDKNLLLLYLRSITTLVPGDSPLLNPASFETILSKLLQRGLTLNAGHSLASPHTMECKKQECRLWHDFLCSEVYIAFSHRLLSDNRMNSYPYNDGGNLKSHINWRGVETFLRFGADPNIYLAPGLTPNEGLLLGATG